METVFIFTYSSSVYRYVNVYTSLTEVLFCPFFWSRFSSGFGAVSQQGAPCLIYFLLQVAQQRWAFVRAKNSRLQLGRARFEKCLITLRQVYTYNFCVWCLVTNLDTVLLALCLIHANCMRICRMSFVYAYPSLLF